MIAPGHHVACHRAEQLAKAFSLPAAEMSPRYQAKLAAYRHAAASRAEAT